MTPLPTPPQRLSLIISAYNEEEALPRLFHEVLETFGPRAILEIIIVNDGSIDRTAQVMRSLRNDLRSARVQGQYRRVRITLCSLRSNMGMGAALRMGYTLASEPWVTFLPGDGQISPAMIPRLCEAVTRDTDLVTTYYTNREYTPYRKLLSRGLRLLSTLIVGVNVVSEGSYLIRRQVLDAMPLTSTSFMLNLEIPIRAARAQVGVALVGIEVRARQGGVSSATQWGRIFQTFRDLIALRLRLIREAQSHKASKRLYE